MQKRERVLSIFFQYLLDKKILLSVILAMVLMFALVIYLYALPLKGVGYATLLSSFIGLAALALDFILYLRKHYKLQELAHSISLTPISLPEATNLLEADYQQLIGILHQEQQRLNLAHDRATDEMKDYYTLWAHQIKVPLAALDLLMQTDSQEKEIIQAELFRIEQYVEMALNFMRLESSSSDYVLHHYPLDPIIRQAVRKYARLFILKNITLEYTGTAAQALTDEKWLSFVIEQLLSNAIKYTVTGHVTVSVNDHMLTITDSGIGIAKNDIPRIFEKGFTGYNGRQEKKSSGLGLYLCKRVLEKLSHTIHIESQVGQGTTVTIGFPQEKFLPE